jgi:hypothetical protein
LAGNWTGYFPQYFTRAIFDGLFQVTSFILYSKEIPLTLFARSIFLIRP